MGAHPRTHIEKNNILFVYLQHHHPIVCYLQACMFVCNITHNITIIIIALKTYIPFIHDDTMGMIWHGRAITIEKDFALSNPL